MTSLEVTVTPKPPETGPGWDIAVKVSTGSQPRKTRWAGDLKGAEADYLVTLVEAVAHAFQFGETTRSVVVAATATRKAARRHGLLHWG